MLQTAPGGSLSTSHLLLVTT